MPENEWGVTFVTTDDVTLQWDVRAGGYGERSDADITIRRVPWSQTQKVVVQGTGVNPSTREYRSLCYGTEAYGVIHAQLGATGVLVVGYPVVRQTPTIAVLMSLAEETINNDGSVQFTAGFTILGPA